MSLALLFVNKAGYGWMALPRGLNRFYSGLNLKPIIIVCTVVSVCVFQGHGLARDVMTYRRFGWFVCMCAFGCVCVFADTARVYFSCRLTMQLFHRWTFKRNAALAHGRA